jgi:hypothetical protein
MDPPKFWAMVFGAVVVFWDRVRPNRRAQALHGVNRSFGNVLTSTGHGASLRT